MGNNKINMCALGAGLKLMMESISELSKEVPDAKKKT